MISPTGARRRIYSGIIMATNAERVLYRRLRFSGRTRNLPWYPRRGTREDLAALFTLMGFTAGVEVGTYKGEFAKRICELNPGIHVTCVDPWTAYHKWTQEFEDNVYEMARENLSGLNVDIVRKRSLEAVDSFADGALDFVNIDGDHVFDSAMIDIIKWVPKVRVGGIVMVHDYHVIDTGADVVKAVDAYTHCHDIRPWYVTHEPVSPTAFWVRK